MVIVKARIDYYVELYKGQVMKSFTLKQVGQYAIDVDAGPWKFRIDLPPKNGGGDSGPGPTDLVPIAVAACEMMLALISANKHGHPLTGLVAEVDKKYAANPTRIADMHVTLKNVLSQLPPELHERVKAAIATCPVVQTLEHPPKVFSEIS